MKKSFIKYFALVLAVIMLSAFAVSAAGYTPVNGYTPAEKHQFKFNSKGEFKILQLSDIQDNFVLSPAVPKFIKYVIEKTQPDIIVLTGDNIAGYLNGTLLFPETEKTLVKKSIDEFMKIIDPFGIPVIITFGNHDDQLTQVSKEEQIAMYQEYSCYIGHDETVENVFITGAGNEIVPIFDSSYTPVDTDSYDANLDDAFSNHLAYALMIVDSNTYVDRSILTLDGLLSDYDAVHEDQIKWFTGKMNALSETRGKKVHSMAFQHIIVPDIFDALKEVPAGTNGAVEKNGKYYVLPDGAKGDLGEAPCPANKNAYCNQYDRFVAVGTDAFFFGHDHSNTFEVDYKGAKMIATAGMGFQSYGNESRGARIITLMENGGNVTFDSEMVYYLDTSEGGFSENEYQEDEVKAHSRENLWDAIVAWFKTIFRYFAGLFGL